jgi:threonine synthase
MKYISTRGGHSAHSLKPGSDHLGQSQNGEPQSSFKDVLLGGLAPDGGLVMPHHYPKIDLATLQRWQNLPYSDLAYLIFRLYCSDIPETDLRELCKKTYTAQVFGSDQITPVSQLAPGLHLLHLSNGPTLAFKDIAMQMLGNLFEYALAQKGEHLNILGATSGDTGSAAEYAMRGKHNVKVFMLSPARRMSAFQTAQMFSLQDPNIFNIAVDGVFDDCQDMVKAVSNDAQFKSHFAIGTVNSINWGRVLAQVVYYFKAYLTVRPNCDGPVSFTVPSGNFGNVFAGHVARMMGLPIAKLVVATNENNVLHEFFTTGTYRVRSGAQTYLTSSPSMDISKASNFERFVFDLVGQDGQMVKQLWQSIDQNGVFHMPEQVARFAQFGFGSGSSTHANRLATIAHWHQKTGRVFDTHTADGLFVGAAHADSSIPMICLETALPAKFSESIQEAIGQPAPRPEKFANIESFPQKFTSMPARLDLLKRYIAQRVS